MQEPGKHFPWGISVAVVLAIFGLYVGAYFGMVEPRRLHGWLGPVCEGDEIELERMYAGEASPSYPQRWNSNPWLDAKWFFSPIHSVDRRMRPGVWGRE